MSISFKRWGKFVLCCGLLVLAIQEPSYGLPTFPGGATELTQGLNLGQLTAIAGTVATELEQVKRLLDAAKRNTDQLTKSEWGRITDELQELNRLAEKGTAV